MKVVIAIALAALYCSPALAELGPQSSKKMCPAMKAGSKALPQTSMKEIHQICEPADLPRVDLDKLFDSRTLTKRAFTLEELQALLEELRDSAAGRGEYPVDPLCGNRTHIAVGGRCVLRSSTFPDSRRKIVNPLATDPQAPSDTSLSAEGG